MPEVMRTRHRILSTVRGNGRSCRKLCCRLYRIPRSNEDKTCGRCSSCMRLRTLQVGDRNSATAIAGTECAGRHTVGLEPPPGNCACIPAGVHLVAKTVSLVLGHHSEKTGFPGNSDDCHCFRSFYRQTVNQIHEAALQHNMPVSNSGVPGMYRSQDLLGVS
jgi:hypothetical protein